MSAATIAKVHGRRVWDSRGRPTVEAEIHLTGGAIGRAIAPAGASRGRHEAIDLRDGGAPFGGDGVAQAVANVLGPIADAITGLEATDQGSVDQALMTADGTANKARLGGNAMIAVSMAVAHAAAAAAGVPLYRYLANGKELTLPLPEIQIFGGGAHAGRRIDIQDLMVVCRSAESFAQALDMTAEVYRAAGLLMAESGRLQGVADEGGYWPAFDTNEQALETLVAAIERAGFTPGEEVAIALDIAASEFYRDGLYCLALDDRTVDSDGFAEQVAGWIERYPIISVEDPLAETDHAGMRSFTQAMGKRVRIIGDDYLVTDAARVRAAVEEGACNAVLIKPNQAGTLSETRDALEVAQNSGWDAVVSARSGETEDVTIVHLAIGWGAEQLKVGSFARSERMAKWNEALRIEEALGASARLAEQKNFPAG
jgi:enolase